MLILITLKMKQQRNNEVFLMLKKVLTFLNDTIEKPLFTDNEPNIWYELEDDFYEEELDEKYRLF